MVKTNPAPIKPVMETVFRSEGTSCKSTETRTSLEKKEGEIVKKASKLSIVKLTASTTRPFFKITGLINSKFKVLLESKDKNKWIESGILVDPIADCCSVCHFNMQFRIATGVAPREYRIRFKVK
jgi:hypothetical protein